MTKHHLLAKKLKALADKGIGGEKQNAEKLLNDLLQKHNITLEEIEEEKIEDHYFNLNPGDHKIWMQVIKGINYDIKCYGPFPKEVVEEHNLKGNYMISCTASEYIEIEAKYDFFSRLYNEELSIFYTAFCKANDLLVTVPDRETKEPTKEDFEKWMRINRMSHQITQGEFRKQLSSG